MSEHFKIEEFLCRCGCNKVFVHPDLIPTLERIRGGYGLPMIITSGYRCLDYNKILFGGPEHPAGEAADVWCVGDENRFKLVSVCLAAGIKRLGIGRDFIHIGISKTLPQPAIWLYGD